MSAGIPVNDPDLKKMGLRLRELLADVRPPASPDVSIPESSLVLAYDPLAEGFEVTRREAALGDGESGSVLGREAAFARPAITGDGSTVLFVNTEADLCAVQTVDGHARECLGIPSRIKSVAISPDAQRVAFVLRDAETGQPEGSITVLDLGRNQFSAYPLAAPSVAGATVEEMLWADFITFSFDGSAVIYDAACMISFGENPSVRRWSIYSLEIDTGNMTPIVPPFDGLDSANPATSRTGNRYMVFDAYHAESDSSAILVLDRVTSQSTTMAIVKGSLGYPSFSSDDKALFYAVPDSEAEITGYSILHQTLSEDRLQAVGDPVLWFGDADLGLTYRRATDTPNLPPTVTLSSSADTVAAPGSVTLTATATDPDGLIARVEFYRGTNQIGQALFEPYTYTWENIPPGNHLLIARAIDNLGSSKDSPPRLLTVSGPSEPGNRPRLAIKAMDNTRVRLTVNGQPGEYIIAVSQDLVEWSDLYPLTINPEGTASIDDSGGPMNHPAFFYRMRRAE
jgi:hypothetical protein